MRRLFDSIPTNQLNPTKFLAPFAVLAALLFTTSNAHAQANVYMQDSNGGFYYVMSGLMQTNILGVDVFAGSGTDGTGQGANAVVVVPTATHNKFVYFIGGTASPGSPLGTVGVFCITPQGTIEWESTTGDEGTAILF